MKLTINKNQLSDNINSFMRRAGYAYIRDRHSGKESYARRLTGNFYPRLHCYIFDQGNQITFNIHLDQRPTRYQGQKAHAGENDSPVVREEIERLEKMVNKQTSNNSEDSFEKITEEKPKKSWWPFS